MRVPFGVPLSTSGQVLGIHVQDGPLGLSMIFTVTRGLVDLSG